MVMLSAGVLLWAVVHLVPGPGQTIRQKIIGAIGERPYKGVFSLALLLALALIVLQVGLFVLNLRGAKKNDPAEA